jgi:methylmalonyl-CoA mutase N-terminal domain/subunit
MGYDADSPLSEGEVGKCGVAVSSLADMEVLFDEIPARASHRFANDQCACVGSVSDVFGSRREAGR